MFKHACMYLTYIAVVKHEKQAIFRIGNVGFFWCIFIFLLLQRVDFQHLICMYNPVNSLMLKLFPEK